jgi:hypothetical protein
MLAIWLKPVPGGQFFPNVYGPLFWPLYAALAWIEAALILQIFGMAWRSAVKPVSQTSLGKCAKCGNQNEIESLFCGDCGAKLRD